MEEEENKMKWRRGEENEMEERRGNGGGGEEMEKDHWMRGNGKRRRPESGSDIMRNIS